jgi:membrane-associated phospholipid phosphatase
MTVAHPRGVLFVTLALFVALAGFAATAGVFPADVAVRDQVVGLASPSVLAVVRVVNVAGTWEVLLPGTLMLLAAFPLARPRWWIWFALMTVAMAAPDLLKILVGRPRPEAASYGFPSGHSTAAAAFFGAVVYLAGALSPLPRRIVRAAALAMIVLVALARVMLHAHWPSDALGGVTLGLALTSLAILVAEQPFTRRSAAPGSRAPQEL